MFPSGRSAASDLCSDECERTCTLPSGPKIRRARRNFFDDALAVTDLRHRLEMRSEPRPPQPPRDELPRREELDREKLDSATQPRPRSSRPENRNPAHHADGAHERKRDRSASCTPRQSPCETHHAPRSRCQPNQTPPAHRRLLIGLQNNPAGRQRIVHARRRRHQARHTTATRRRRHIDLKRGNTKIDGIARCKTKCEASSGYSIAAIAPQPFRHTPAT